MGMEVTVTDMAIMEVMALMIKGVGIMMRKAKKVFLAGLKMLFAISEANKIY